MRKLYSPLFFILFASCGTQVQYLGSSYPSTEKVDIFVNQASVKRPFEVIGKGYVRRNMGPAASIEIIQKKAIEKAKVKGANAVVIEDYYVVDNTSSVTIRTDSLRKIQTTDINPAVSSGFTILFLKYKE